MEKQFKKREGSRPRKYGILARDKNGQFIGFVNYPFSMNWSYNGIYLWDQPPLHYCSGQEKDGRFIVRVGSKTCPINIDLKHYSKDGKYNNKFSKKLI